MTVWHGIPKVARLTLDAKALTASKLASRGLMRILLQLRGDRAHDSSQ